MPKACQDTTLPSPLHNTSTSSFPTDGTADTLHSQVCGPHDGTSHTSTPWSWTLKAYKWGKKRRRGITSWPDMIKMELSRVHLLLGAVGFLLWTSGGSAAPMECHFSSRGEIQFFVTLFKKKPKHLPLKKPHQFIKNVLFWALPPTMCSSSSVCVWGEALLTGWNLDGQRLHAMHLSAPCWGRLLWDVSTQTDGVIWCPDANSF